MCDTFLLSFFLLCCCVFKKIYNHLEHMRKSLIAMMLIVALVYAPPTFACRPANIPMAEKLRDKNLFIGVVKSVDSKNVTFSIVTATGLAREKKTGQAMIFKIRNTYTCGSLEFKKGQTWLYDGDNTAGFSASQKLQASDLKDGIDLEKVKHNVISRLEQKGDDYIVQPSSVAPEKRFGMTWGVLKHPAIASEFVHAQCDGLPGAVTASGHNCDPYKGDTQCNRKLPLLCVHDMHRPFPDDILDRQQYHGWFGGDIDTSITVKGTDLTSWAIADKICADKLGDGWRMAEFHDGRGWGFWAKGKITADSRFWVAINDQPANCWDDRSNNPAEPETMHVRTFKKPDFIPEELYSPRLLPTISGSSK